MSETEVLENQGKLDELYIKEYLDQLKTAEQASYKADREYEADSKNTEKKEAFVEARKTEIQACLAAAEALVKITDGAIDIPTAKSLIKEQRAGVHEICEGLEHGLTKEQVRLYANPEFSNLQLWFSTLLFCCLWTYLKTGRKYLLAVSALWLSLLVLAYPSCAIVLFGVILLLALYSPYKKRDILLVSGICAILGTAAGGYFLCTVGPENLKACLSGMLALEPTHTEGFFARLSVYGSDLLIQGFLLAAAGVVVLPPLVIVRRKRGSRCSGLGIWLLAVCGVLLAGFFFNILSARNRFAYSIILLFAAGLGFLCRKNLNGREKQIYFCGSVIGGLCFLATLMLSDLPLPVSVPYGLLLAGVSLIPIEKQASKSADTIIIRGLPLCYACFVLLLAFRCVYIRTPLSGKAQICPSVGSSMSLVRSGPALGLISNEDGVCIQRDSYPEWKKWIRPGDKVWIIGGVVDTLGYLYEDVEIAGPSTISTPYYSEAVLSYWKLNPDKYPDVIVAEGYLGTLSHELQTNQWLMDWLAQEYRPAQIIEGKFWNYYFKTSRETEDGQ